MHKRLTGLLVAALAVFALAAPAHGATYGKQAGAGSSSAAAPAPMLQAALIRAQAVLGTTITTCIGTDFENDQWHVAYNPVGGSAVLGTTTKGGVIVLSTSATPNGQMAIRPHGNPSLVSALSTDPWYATSRAKITTTPDANTLAWFANLTSPTNGTNIPAAQIGVFGSVSTGFFSARLLNNSATQTAAVTSSIAVDALYHTMEEWSDGTTTVTFAIDGSVIGTTTNNNLGTGAVTLAAGVFNTSSSANQSITIDKMAICVVGN